MPTAAAGRPVRVLFLCTGNSARSVMAEALLNHLGGGRYRAQSAGSHPKGRVHPLALELLARKGLPTAGLRSKGWDEFAGVAAPPVDVIVTVCDNAAGEACPVVPARAALHWSVADPAGEGGTEAERRAAFEAAFADLERRIRALLAAAPRVPAA
jgi:arsenate reductase